MFKLINLGIAVLLFDLTIAVLLVRRSKAAEDNTERENCKIEVPSRPETEYNLCALNGDTTIPVGNKDLMKSRFSVKTSSTRKRLGSIQLNLFEAIQTPKASPLGTDCVANSTVCYIAAPKMHTLTPCLHPNCRGEAYSFGVNKWHVKEIPDSRFRTNVPELVFNTTGPVFSNYSETENRKSNHGSRLQTHVELHCDERYDEGDVLKQVELPKNSSGVLIVKLSTKQSCLTYKSPKPECIEGPRLACPFYCKTMNKTYNIDKIQPKQFTISGSLTYFFRLCHGMNINSSQSKCNSKDTIICERRCKTDLCDRQIASRKDDIRVELIPDGFVWQVYPPQLFRGERTRKKAVVSFYCDELLKGHEFRLTHYPSDILWFSLRGPCVCENSAKACVDFVPHKRSSSLNLVMIIGFSLGGVALLVIFAVIMYWKKQRPCNNRKTASAEGTDSEQKRLVRPDEERGAEGGLGQGNAGYQAQKQGEYGGMGRTAHIEKHGVAGNGQHGVVGLGTNVQGLKQKGLDVPRTNSEVTEEGDQSLGRHVQGGKTGECLTEAAHATERREAVGLARDLHVSGVERMEHENEDVLPKQEEVAGLTANPNGQPNNVPAVKVVGCKGRHARKVNGQDTLQSMGQNRATIHSNGREVPQAQATHVCHQNDPSACIQTNCLSPTSTPIPTPTLTPTSTPTDPGCVPVV